jgi:2,4-dienoyl-CoA reductase-like NADH-dependent reductase (Old Yellow Enzyme family)
MDEATTILRTPHAAQAPNTDVLFLPYRLGTFNLRHRIVMAPLTRSRARQPGNVPSSLAACYYAQRATAALIVSEATQVSMQGQGYAWTPGIHSREIGRISHPALQPDNMLPVAPSAIIPEGKAFIENERGEGELVPFVRPRALNIEEMPYIVAQYERAAINARAADFDGVEIHAANGYLLDQFIETGTNRRTDTYGGPIENRTRLLFEVAEALIRIWGPDRADAERKSAGSADARLGRNYPEKVQGNSDGGGRLPGRQRGAVASRRQGGPDRFRPQVHRQSRSARAVAHWRTLQCRRSDDVLRRRREGVHGLSVSSTGSRRTIEGLYRPALAVSGDR